MIDTDEILKSIPARIAKSLKLDVATGCLLWTGYKNADGYGLTHWNGKMIRVHRLLYLIFKGDVPSGMVPDHLCRTRNCANPAHLEVVSNRVNILRGSSPTAENSKKTHCANGHEFTPENTFIRKSHDAERRRCRTCHRAEDRARVERKKKAGIR